MFYKNGNKKIIFPDGIKREVILNSHEITTYIDGTVHIKNYKDDVISIRHINGIKVRKII